MGCSNARLFVHPPLTDTNTMANLNANNPLNPLPNAIETPNKTSPIGITPDANNTSTRMHLTGVDLVVERNGSYTLLLTPKTHKQLMPYVLRKKRFRILVDKSRTDGTSPVNVPLNSYDIAIKEKIMESDKELQLTEKSKKQSKELMESTVETVQQVATDELEKTKARFIGGRSIDRGDPEDENANIQSDDEGMIEEIVTTVEEDKDLECKVKKKIETKKTVAQDPETHNKITKVVKTEVTEITRTITINDQHDLERAKRELGIDDVGKLLSSTQISYNMPSTYHSTSAWIDQPRLIQVHEKYYDPSNEIVTSGDFPSDSPVKQHSPTKDIIENDLKQEQTLADATTVGRGAVVETILSSQSAAPVTSTSTDATAKTDEGKPIETKKKKKKSSLNLCSCTRSTANDYDEEQRKQKAATIIEKKSKQKKKASGTTTNTLLTSSTLQTTKDTQSQGQALISNEIKQLIKDKKSLLIDYIHSKIFQPAKLFASDDQDQQARNISSDILDLLENDHCSSWNNLTEQVQTKTIEQSSEKTFIQPMIKTYEDLFTTKQSNLLNTFSTIHNQKDIQNLPENIDYITIVQTNINDGDNEPNISAITKPFVENIEDTIERLQTHSQSNEKVIDDDHEKQQRLVDSDKDVEMSDSRKKSIAIYNEEQLAKMLADISLHKPMTLAEAIAYEYLDLEDPKLGLSNDTIQRIKSLFRRSSPDDESTLNLIRIQRSGQYLTDFNLGELSSFEQFHLSQPFIYQLQQSFEPRLDLNEKQFRSLTEAILNNKEEYSNLQFDIGRSLIPAGDMKESSTNDFSNSDSGYSMTTATYESLASKAKNEFETINEPMSDQIDESDKTIDQIELSSDYNNTQTKQILQSPTTDTIDENKVLSSTSVVTKETQTSEQPNHIKKRKSTGFLSCFRNKKAKASTEQHGQPTISAANALNNNQEKRDSVQEKPFVDYAILPDGKRIYIDAFHDRPGLDMSYKPNNFDTQFSLPAAKSPSDYERSITPENMELPSTVTESFEEKPNVQIETTIEPLNIELEAQPIATETIVETTVVDSEMPILTSESENIEHKSVVHLEARPPTIEKIEVPEEPTPVVLSSKTKSDETTLSKAISNLHGAAVELPEIELNKPGPLPTITITKEKHKKSKETTKTEKPLKTKKSTGGLCASCFGSKAAKKKDVASETAQAPIEQEKKNVEEEKKDEVSPTSESSPVPVLPPATSETITVPDIEVSKTVEQTTSEISPILEERLDITIEKIVHTEEPHYESPSSEPVPPVTIEIQSSVPEPNTYDTPRLTETPEEKIVTNEITNIIETNDDIKKSIDDIIPSEQKVESTIVAQIEAMPNVEIKDSTKKGSYTFPGKKPKTKKPKEPKQPKEPKEPKVKSERKSGLFATFFRHSDRKSKVPALDLPSVEQELAANTESQEVQIQTNDPFHIPNADLPQLDVPLPSYDRPEVDMTSGQLKQSSEFSIPAVELPPIPNLNLPEAAQSQINTTIDPLKVPSNELPELQLTINEQETHKLPEIHIKSEKIVKPELAPVQVELKQTPLTVEVPTLSNEVLDVQIDENAIKLEPESPIPDLPKLPLEDVDIVIKPELLTTEQKYTITDTQFISPPELPNIVETQTIENIEVSTKIPDLEIQLPSVEPVTMAPKDIDTTLPSFEKDVSTTAVTSIVPAIEISTTPIKSSEKQLIEPKNDIKKKSSTLALCSCFGSKSTGEKEKEKDKDKVKDKRKSKTKTLEAPKTDLPVVEMPNPTSTIKTDTSLRAPSNDLPTVDLTLPSVEPIQLPTIHTFEKKRQAPKKPSNDQQTAVTQPEVTITVVNNNEAAPSQTDVVLSTEQEQPVVEPIVIETTTVDSHLSATPAETVEKQLDDQTNVQPPIVIETTTTESISLTSPIEKQSTDEIKEIAVESKKISSFEMKAPAFQIPELDLTSPPKADAYVSSAKHEETIQSRSDSGLEAIISSHMQTSSTFPTNPTTETLNQLPSISSGLGSEVIDSTTPKDSTLSDIQKETELKSDNNLVKHDFTRKITMNDELRAKLIFKQNDLKKCLETEIANSIEDFDAKKDQKPLNKILTHGIDLIKNKKVTTYPELKKKLIMEHKHDAFIVDPVVHSLYFTIEQQGLDNLDKPEFPLAIRDMVRLPDKQTLETVTPVDKEIKKEAAQITQEKPSSTRSCLTCGHSRSKPKVISTPAPPSATIQTGLLDERRRVQLNTHRNELGTTIRDHIQSSQPPIRQFAEHPKEIEKIIRKSLTLVTQPKILSYEQIRNDLKTEYKQTFYLVDPTVDIIRDTFDHCDITQMNEKTNLDILDSNITQTANLYNQTYNQTNLLTTEEYNSLKSNQLTWLNQYLIDNELNNKKLTRKQTKELQKIMNRTLEILSLNLISTWDELSSQLRREFSKAHDLCDRSIELIKQAQKDGLLLLKQSPNAQQDVTSINVISVNGKRRLSSLLTDRARQNLHNNRKKIISSITTLLHDYNKPLYTEHQIETYVSKTFHCLEDKKYGDFKTYNDLKDKLKKDYKHNHEKLIEQIVDVIEQAHATNQFDDLDKPEVQSLMKDRLDGKPLVLKEMYVSLPPRAGAFASSKHSNDDSSRYLSTSNNGDQTLNSSTSSHRIARGLSWREANERARILFYRGKHPAIHYDEQAAAFDVRMLLETTAGGTQEIPVTDSDVHELLNSCGVQWDGVNIISLVDHSEDVVRAAEQAALRVIREKGLVELRTPPSTRNTAENDEPLSS